MGCDGGTIPTRDELVKLKKKPEQRDKDGHRIFRWQHCAITQQPLRKPVMACELGRLYNKEAVIELLLNKEREDVALNTDHIEKLKDVVELSLSVNPAYNAKKHAVGDGMYNDALVSPWICPVTGLEMNGRFKFVFAFTSGKVVAERALAVLKKDPAEAQTVLEEDLVTINPEEEELDLMSAKMFARRARVKAAKKAAKEAAKLKKSGGGEFKVPEASSSSSSSGSGDSPKEEGDGTAEPAKKKSKTGDGGFEFSAFSDQKKRRPEDKKTNDPTKVKSSKSKSIQDDPHASEVYKRLFSSHKTALNQPKGNWVTFDPRYN